MQPDPPTKPLLDRLGYSDGELARLLQVSQSTVNRWRSGKTTPSPVVLRFLKGMKPKAHFRSARKKALTGAGR